MTGDARRHAPASRIVRIGRGVGPLLVAVAVLATAAFAVPHDAWLPRNVGSATGAAWEAEPGRGLDAIVALQVASGRWAWSADVVRGAIAVAAACAAASAALLTSTLRSAGLPTSQSALLALVAAAAPFAGWCGSSPLGAAPVTLASVAVLALVAGGGAARRNHQRGAAPSPGRDGTAGAPKRSFSNRVAPSIRLATVLVLLVALGEVLTTYRHVSTLAATWGVLRNDLGPIGLVLLAVAATTAARIPLDARLWLGAATAWLLTLPVPGEVRAAAMLPWAWCLVGIGVSNVTDWRGARTWWASVGLVAWLALHVAARPWGHERRQAALVGTWAGALADRLAGTQPLIVDRSPRGHLLAALVASRARASSQATIAPVDAHHAVRAGHQPVAVSASQFETLRWSGLGFAPWEADVGAALEGILDALPPGTVTLAVISAEGAGRLSPRQWQALGRVGLRLPDAGARRAHALVGMTGARVQALEAARAGSIRLDVQPGDVLGRTASRSPVDARLDADHTRVSVWLRGQLLLDQVEGLALVFFTSRGDMLGWRAGPDPAHLDGPALGPEPATRAMAVAALPCMTVPAGRETDVTSLTGSGALGITWTGPARLDVTLDRPRDWQPSVVRLVEPAPGAPAPTLIGTGTSDRRFAVQGRDFQVAGIYLRGPVTSARARSDNDVRLCAAWPMPLALAPGSRAFDMPVAPRYEPHFGSGWHDMELQPGVGYFRWMSGPRAELLLALRRAEAFTFALDAQAPLPPGPGDEVRLVVAGRDLGHRPLFPTRGIYTWNIPADALREGVNALTLGITRTARPTHGDAGDARELGLLVRGWTFRPPASH